MALDLTLSNNSHKLVQLEDGPIYWFLYSYFEDIKIQTGYLFDLYSHFTFNDGEKIKIIKEFLKVAKKDVDLKDNEWDQVVGYSYPPPQKPIYEKVSKISVLDKINELLSLVDESIMTNTSIVGEGD